jgi:hypothetical protein
LPMRLSNAVGSLALAEARKPPSAGPAEVAAVDEHLTLVFPASERDKTPLSLCIFPVSAVGMRVSKSGIILVYSGDIVWRLGGTRSDFEQPPEAVFRIVPA